MTITHSFNVIPFSTRLATLRVLRGLSQAELAREAGVDPSIISRYERGLLPPNHHIEAIETALGIDLDAPQVEQAFKILAGAEPPALPLAAVYPETEESDICTCGHHIRFHDNEAGACDYRRCDCEQFTPEMVKEAA